MNTPAPSAIEPSSAAASVTEGMPQAGGELAKGERRQRRLRKILKISLGGLWALSSLLCLVFWLRSGWSIAETPQALADWVHGFGYGKAIVIYLFLYTLRPLILFPSSFMTLAAGLAFGPIVGFFVTLVGENTGANLAFRLSRTLGRRWIERKEIGRLQRWDDHVRERGMVFVLLLRLLYVPFDTVSYLCGLTAMRQRDFAMGTLLGAMPYIVTFSLLGGSVSAGLTGSLAVGSFELPLRWILVGLSALLFVAGLVLARYLRRSHGALAAFAGNSAAT